ncbi:helix-turn-helix domain-containing protein [Roseimicrobium sp. ORNL1]|uniref:helix-turn-helix transcriptional regulator n=1 Tax=Roseimicrobium sp. ORNL1 TaxID=2711231 RepID=UPI0013E11542|nr:helix-turn-helix domain-containing protein [Roseimicrobium sp. ORNL1]QIF01642.1 helix-turn-helix domain-containing protein [Roseimicrobium sp. ORNL1]
MRKTVPDAAKIEPYLNIRQIAEHFCIAEKTAYRWSEDGTLPHYKLNARVLRFKLSECEAAMQKRRVMSVSEARAA